MGTGFKRSWNRAWVLLSAQTQPWAWTCGSSRMNRDLPVSLQGGKVGTLPTHSSTTHAPRGGVEHKPPPPPRTVQWQQPCWQMQERFHPSCLCQCLQTIPNSVIGSSSKAVSTLATEGTEGGNLFHLHKEHAWKCPHSHWEQLWGAYGLTRNGWEWKWKTTPPFPCQALSQQPRDQEGQNCAFPDLTGPFRSWGW